MSFVTNVEPSLSPSLLVVLVDLESLLVALKAQQSDPDAVDLSFAVQALSVFATSHALMQRNNRLCILAYHSFGTEFVFPSRDVLASSANPVLDFNIVLHDLQPSIHTSFEDIFQSFLEQSTKTNQRIGEQSTLSTALSTAITIVHRQQQLFRVQSRILVLQFDRDIRQNYNAVMNCIFRFV
jgi:hypothetical protein